MQDGVKRARPGAEMIARARLKSNDDWERLERMSKALLDGECENVDRRGLDLPIL